MMMTVITIISRMTLLAICFLPVIFVHAEDFLQSESSLRRTVFQNYDKTLRPAANVTVLVRRLQVFYMDVKEDAHALLLHGAIELTWEDARLKWSLEDHDDVDRLGVDPDDLWRPDLTMTSSLISDATPPRSQVPALVYPDGEVIFVPPVYLPLTCVLDLTYWPYDMLNCSITAGSWVHHGHMLNLTLANDALKFALIPGMDSSSSSSSAWPEWEVVTTNLTRHTQTLSCCSEPQVTLVVEVVIRRSAPAITWIMKTPVLCLCVLTCLVFLLPPNGSEKVVFGSVCVLLNILFLGLSSTIVYKDPIHTPLIVQLVMHQVVLTVVSVVVAVVVMRLARGPHTFPLPYTINKVSSSLATVLCLSSCSRRALHPGQHYSEMMAKPEQIELGEPGSGEGEGRGWPQNGGQWMVLATVVDRVFLLLYVAACVATFIMFYPVL